MANLWVLQAFSGSSGIAVAVLTAPALMLWAVLLGFTVARYRVPALLWWFPALLALALAAFGSTLDSASATAAVHQTDVHDLIALATEVTARHHAALAVAGFWSAGWLISVSLTVAAISSWRLEYPTTDWLAAVLPVATGAIVTLAAVVLALTLRTGPVPTVSLVLIAGAGISSICGTTLRNSLSKSERVRVGATRALVMSLGIGGVIACGFAWHHLEAAARMATDGTVDSPTRPVGLATLAFVLAVAASGLPTLATARGAIGSLRSIASAGALGGLILLDVGVIWLARPDMRLVDASSHGAVDRVPDALWTRLPIARDLNAAARSGEQIDASCLIREATDGWAGEPLFAAIPPALHVERSVLDPNAVHELDRSPGCPAVLGPLDGPLASSEIPVIAMDGTRAGAALSGWEWFNERGSLRVLVQADPVDAAQWSRRATRMRATAVPFVWERPPRVQPPEGHVAGVWDETYAASLPVTLLEGPYPVLLAGGLRSRLPAGELGIETLQLALASQPPHRRDLVLVPRKSWTVQDLVGFCLSAQSEVEGVRCVVRPETPARWSLRTRLPLPW